MLASQGRYDFMNEFMPTGVVSIKDILAHLRSKNPAVDEIMFQSGFFAYSKFRSVFAEARSDFIPAIQDIIFDYMDRLLV